MKKMKGVARNDESTENYHMKLQLHSALWSFRDLMCFSTKEVSNFIKVE